MAIEGCKGAVFDLDGVITETAVIHSKAWKAMFDEFLKKKNLPEFTQKEYFEFVDGKPRYDGVKSFLESRKITLPYGDPSDTAGKQTICGLGNTKNDQYQKIIQKEKPHVFESSVRLIKALKKKGLKVGIASSSKNTKLILKLTGLTSLFDTIVDGLVSAELKLNGKPEPDIFIQAAKNMGLRPGQSIVFEDAVSGVQAGQNGNFGLVVGVKRGEQALKAADIIVSDLGKLTVKRIKEWFAKDIEKKAWKIEYHTYHKDGEGVREAIATLGNGYLGTRGCHVTERDDDVEHYPGTYLAGIFNKLTSNVHGKKVDNTDIVNIPDWRLVQLKINGTLVSPFEEEILEYKQELHLKDGTLTQDITFRDGKERETRLVTKRFASMDDPHKLGLKVEVTALNYSGTITLGSFIDGNIKNNNVARYRQLRQKHLIVRKKGIMKNSIFMHVQTNQSMHSIMLRAQHSSTATKKIAMVKDAIGEIFTYKAAKKKTIKLEKMVAVRHSVESRYPEKDLFKTELGSFSEELKKHKRAWNKLWNIADISLSGDLWTQRVIRLHIFHLLVTASPHNAPLDAGMPARGIHGEGYRGHIFWDTLYVLPFYTIRFPDIARSLLKYRYRRLPAAEKYAQEFNYKGAMYPWQSADTGNEETQTVHYNPNSKTWGPDMSSRQRHVSIAIFYNFWKEYSITGDKQFLQEYGSEVMLEIARFWASLAQKGKDKKYHIEGVMGPDEFHEKLPRTKVEGLKDNAYTNIMVSWVLTKAITIAELFPEKLSVSQEEILHWKDVSDHLSINVEKGIIEQFDGYFKLPELDWKHYRKKYGDVSRMDRILKAEGKSPDSYKVTKQADTLMPYFTLDINEVTDILKKMGVKVSNPITFLKKQYAYYEPRTSHGSTLSKIVHGIISSYMSNEKLTREFFDQSLISDISEVIRKDTAEGIHTGLMAGSIDFVIRRFAGVNFQKDILDISPGLPDDWKSLSFKMTHKGVWYTITLTQKYCEVQATKTTPFLFRGTKKRLTKGKRVRFKV
jgi:beta-phosphoglucomutase family hydrolase